MSELVTDEVLLANKAYAELDYYRYEPLEVIPSELTDQLANTFDAVVELHEQLLPNFTEFEDQAGANQALYESIFNAKKGETAEDLICRARDIFLSQQTKQESSDDPRIFDLLKSEDIESHNWAVSRLVEDYGSFVKKNARQLYDMLPKVPGVEVGDLEHEGVIALINIAQKFKPGGPASFLNYAGDPIQSRIGKAYDQMAEGVHLTEPVRLKLIHIAQERAYRHAKRLPKPSLEETAKVARVEASNQLTFPPRRLTVGDLALAEMLTRHMGSINVEFGAIQSSDFTMRSVESFRNLKSLTDRNELTSVESDGIELVDRGILHAAIAELDPRDAEVLALFFDRELGLKEIGEIMGVNHQRVSQLKARALKKLKSPNGPVMSSAPLEPVDR